MFNKFLVLSLLPLHFVCGAMTATNHNLETPHASSVLAGPDSLESYLRDQNCINVLPKVRALLEIYNNNGITQNKIAEIFECSIALVQKFLANEAPGFKLVGAVHRYFVAGGVSLLTELKEAEASTFWSMSKLLAAFTSSSSAPSSRSSSGEKHPNDSFSSQDSTPSKKKKDE